MSYNLLAKSISTINHMFGRAMYGTNCPSAFLKILKLPHWVKQAKVSKFSKITRVIYIKKCPNQRCDYWLITLNQKLLVIENNILTAVNHKSMSRQLQNNTFNGAMLITTNFMINQVNIIFSNKLFHFSYKILNAQVTKSCSWYSCGISAIFFQYVLWLKHEC